MEVARDTQPLPQSETASEEANKAGEREEEENEVLMSKAQALMDRIVATHENPNPYVLHTLATILETQEPSYVEYIVHSSTNNGRSTHNAGRLINLIRENDKFFELISSKFLTESRYSVSVQAAAMRLLFCCSIPRMYPHAFEDVVLENVRGWAINEIPMSSADDRNWKQEIGKRKTLDFEMLWTYSTGLLALCLAGGGQLVEDVSTSGLPAKLMRYLRLRVLGETSTSQKDSNPLIESKSASTMVCSKTNVENRGRLRNVVESSHVGLVVPKKHANESDLDKELASSERDRERYVNRQAYGKYFCVNEKSSYCMALEDACEAKGGGDEKCSAGDSCESKLKPVGKSSGEEDFDENERYDSCWRRTSFGLPRLKGKGRSSGVSEKEQALTSCFGSSSGQAQSMDRSVIKNQHLKRMSKAKRGQDTSDTDDSMRERADNGDCFKECDVGSKDTTDLVKQAVRTAEAESKAADAPVAAINAAGNDTAKVVKVPAFKKYRKTNDEEALAVAATRALSRVIDATKAVSFSMATAYVDDDSGQSKPLETDVNEDIGEHVILDSDPLAKLREKFCIQCLVILGEHAEVLRVVLREKGVDVTLALLQRSLKHKEASSTVHLLNDILKLIYVLAAHRKFAALFVYHGGVQRLLAVPRIMETFFGLSSCLLTIGSIRGIMQFICSFPSYVVDQVVELALQLLECQQDESRKNAALFFSHAFVFRAIIIAFDGHYGLQKLICLLHDAASVSSAVTPGQLNNPRSLQNGRSPSEVQTTYEMQIAYHACVALRQYFRAHLLLLVNSVHPIASIPIPSVGATYEPLDISNEAMDAIFRGIRKNKKLGLAVVRARWHVFDRFLYSNGHITMLELCQASSAEPYFYNLLQYALGVLHVVTLTPNSRKFIVNATLSNGRVGMAVLLDVANGAGYVGPEIVELALKLLKNLACPPRSIRNKSRATLQTSASAVASGFIGDCRIYLGAGAVCARLAAELEHGYRQAREAIHANNGVKVLLRLLQPQMVTSPAALDCLCVVTCQVLRGLANDDRIARILTKLQVGENLSEFIRDSRSQTQGGEQNRWQAKLAQVTVKLIRVVTNSGHGFTSAASTAATPTLGRIERGAIAAATPISSHSRELLLHIHEQLRASGLAETAATLLKETQLTPLPSLDAPSSLPHQRFGQGASSLQIQWPSGRAPCGFLADMRKVSSPPEDPSLRYDSAVFSSKKKLLASSGALGDSKVLPKLKDSMVSSSMKINISFQKNSMAADNPGITSVSDVKSVGDVDVENKTPILLPMIRKLTDLNDNGLVSSGKRLNIGEQILGFPSFTPANIVRRSGLQPCVHLYGTPTLAPKDYHGRLPPNVLSADIDESKYTGSQVGQISPSQHRLLNAPEPCGSERVNLDSRVVQYLEHQHFQFPDRIGTLQPLYLLHPHVCPEPRRSLDAPLNVTARLSTREFRSMYGGIHGSRKDRRFVYSRFRRRQTCKDETSSLQTCISFLGDSSRIATGGHSGELKVFGSSSNSLLDGCTSHQFSLTLLQSRPVGVNQLVLSSTAKDVCLWDASSISGGPKHSFAGIKDARFSNSGSIFAALQSDLTRREIHLYDVQTCQLDVMLSDTSSSTPSGRGHVYSHVHFSPSDSMLIWNGVLWDRRSSDPIHLFDRFADYGGGGFHPAGNQVIINSKVLDLRNLRVLHSVPSLNQTDIMFNASGDVIFAMLRRNREDVDSTFETRRVKHPLFSAFRTIDAVNYSDIARIPVGRCVLDFTTEPTDSFLGLITMDDEYKMYSSARVYEIGRHKPTDDDSDAGSEDEGDDGHTYAYESNDDDSLSEEDDDEDSRSDDDEDSRSDDDED